MHCAGNSYLVFLITLQNAFTSQRGQEVVYAFSTTYIVLTIAQFVFALGNGFGEEANKAALVKMYKVQL